jgi:ADP-L-glycero-D-manno-heptose 6-epimerase
MILLTGGAGFIGFNILEQLNATGKKDIIVVDHINHLNKIKNLSNCIVCNYYDKNEFLSILPSLKNITAILHQGACSSTTETNETYLQQNNVEFSKKLLHYAIEKNIPFLYASSASVYGNGEKGFDDYSNDYNPINGYANSKLVFDQYVQHIIDTKQHQNLIVGFRYFNVYGETHKLHMTSVIYKFYQSYLKTKTLELFEGSDKILRDFIHVDDVVKVNLFFLEKNNIKHSGIYNVGTGKAASFKALALAFQKKYADAHISYIPFPEILKGKYQFFTEAKIDKLQKAEYSEEFQNIEKGVTIYLNKLINDHEKGS